MERKKLKKKVVFFPEQTSEEKKTDLGKIFINTTNDAEKKFLLQRTL